METLCSRWQLRAQPVGGIDCSLWRRPPLVSAPLLLLSLRFSQVVETLQPAGLCLDPSLAQSRSRPSHRLGWGRRRQSALLAASDEPPLPPCQCGGEGERERLSDRESARKRESERESSCVTERERGRLLRGVREPRKK